MAKSGQNLYRNLYFESPFGYNLRAASISILQLMKNVRLLFEGGFYSRAVCIRDFTVLKNS